MERVITETQKRMGGLIRAPRWEAVQCPSLGMYPVPSPLERWLGWYDSLSATERQAGEAYVREYGRWTAAQRAKFGSVPRNRVAEFPDSGHYFFLEKAEESRRIIREFVRSLP